ncbi:MAG: hypothetical protein H7Z74_13765 [Anaerolineae bacterium]|nr:hypothetical protein [Gemmatimonadaceae bacterium]
MSPSEQHGLDLLIDLSRAVPVVRSSPNIVHLEVTGGRKRALTVGECVARGWFIEPADGVVRIDRNALDVVCDIAGASKEQASTKRDRYGRIPSMQSPLAATGKERQAVVSRAAMRLRYAVIQAAGNRLVRFVAPWPNGRRWAAAMTHDLDVVSYWPVFSALRIAELARKRELARVGRVLAAAGRAIGTSPVRDGIQFILRKEDEHGVRSTWFVLCGTPSFSTWRQGDLTYLPEGAQARQILGDIGLHNGEVGLHGSFETLDRGDAFTEQRERLAKLAAGSIAGVRQHFLRLNPATTPTSMAAAGFAYDSSQGFADRNGFRLGVADVVPTWSASDQRATGFDEIPFCWMDRSLSKYGGVEDPAMWVQDAQVLAEECRRVEGLWVGVWHPNLVPALGYPDAPEAFSTLLSSLSEGDPFFGTLADILAWRSARRSVRVRSVGSDEIVEAELPVATRHEVVLEDANGVACATKWLPQ